MKYDKKELKKLVFIFAEKYKRPVDKYFTIKINELTDGNEVMISIIDVSHEVLMNNEKAHVELLTVINATVSHELRNPLNSIVAFNI